MIKKVWLLLLSLFTIFWFWVSFANPIAPRDLPDVCYMIKNVKVGDYKVIIEYGKRTSKDSEKKSFSWWNDFSERAKRNPSYDPWDDRGREVYEAKKNECTKCSYSNFGTKSRVYLLDKNTKIKNLSQENIDDNAIFIWYIYDSDCAFFYDRIETYEITKDWGNYEILSSKTISIKDIKKFPFFWILAIMIETLVLFFIVKLFRENVQISNKKLLLFWIIPTTVTLPLLWFVLPSILWDWILYIVVWELLVAVLEAAMIKYWLNASWKKSIIASIICNVFSFAILWWGSLIMDFYDGQGLIMDIPIWTEIYLPVLYFLIEFAVLCISGKMLWNGEQISNKRLILTWIISPIIMILSFALLIWILVVLHLDNQDRLQLAAILVSLFIEMLLIKYLLKVSWKKSIIMVVLSILCPIVISFFVRILFGL